MWRFFTSLQVHSFTTRYVSWMAIKNFELFVNFVFLCYYSISGSWPFFVYLEYFLTTIHSPVLKLDQKMRIFALHLNIKFTFKKVDMGWKRSVFSAQKLNVPAYWPHRNGKSHQNIRIPHFGAVGECSLRSNGSKSITRELVMILNFYGTRQGM
jgi:hypothetical protein